MSQGGSGQAFYVSDISLFGTSGANFNRTTVDNIQLARPWDGSQPFISHWTPSDDESSFKVTPTTNTFNQVSLMGFYLNGLASGAAFRVEYEIGLEYLPSSAYTQFVMKKTSRIHPDTPYWTSLTAQEHWIPLMLAPYDEYKSHLDIVSSYGALGGDVGSSGALTSMGQISNGNNVDGEETNFSRESALNHTFSRPQTRIDNNPFKDNYLTNNSIRSEAIRNTFIDNASPITSRSVLGELQEYLSSSAPYAAGIATTAVRPAVGLARNALSAIVASSRRARYQHLTNASGL
jgi:hypothetical protein